MSYDLTLFRPPPGVEPLEAWHRIEREEEGFLAVACDVQQVAGYLKHRVPGFVETILEDGSIQLIHDSQVDVLITEREVGMGMPYFRQEVEPMMTVISDCIDCLSGVGFVAYDPQFDKIVTAADFGAMTAHYRDTDKVLPHLVRDAQERKRAREAAAKPWWKFW